MVKLSVVIPAYNSESYLPDTAQSLLSQDFKDFEVIIVNDGSIDGTQAVIDRYCEKYSFIKGIVQKNGGVSSARNRGLSVCSGEYVLFLDADDWYTPSSLGAFVQKAQETGADIVMGRLRNYTDKKPGPFHAVADELAKETKINTFDRRLLWSVLVSNKCYKRDFLLKNDITFPPYTFSEEAVFFLKAVYCKARLAGTEGSCLCYRRHTEEEGKSVSQRACKSSLRSLDCCMSEVYSLAAAALNEAGKEENKSYLEEIVFKQLHVLVSQFYRKLWTLDDDSMDELCAQFESLKSRLTKEKFLTFCEQNRDLDLEHLRKSKKEICEKPLFFKVEEGEEIKKLAEEKGKIVCVTYGFSGFDLLSQMRSMVLNGDIGEVTMVDLRYAHGFACDPTGDKQAEGQKWRVDPAKSGPSFVLGDLSTHTFYMSELICPQLKLKQLLCDRQSFIKSRAPLEDNAYVLMRYENGAVGRMWASAVNAGDMSSQHIRIVGTKASLEWNDMHPDELYYEVQGQPRQTLVRAMDYLNPEALEYERLGALHYTGLIESWSNLYTRFAIAMDAKNRGDEETLKNLVYPDLEHGIDGIRWVTKCVESADKGGVWVDFK